MVLKDMNLITLYITLLLYISPSLCFDATVTQGLKIDYDCPPEVPICAHFYKRSDFVSKDLALYEWGEQITIALWVSNDQLNGGPIINNGCRCYLDSNPKNAPPSFSITVINNNNNNYGSGFVQNENYVSFYLATSLQDGRFDQTWSYPLSVFKSWYHLAMTFDGVERYDYINGKEVGHHSYTPAPIRVYSDPVQLGGTWRKFDYFRGKMADVRMYNRSLSPTELDLVISDPSQNDCNNGLIAWYRLDDDQDFGADSCSYQYGEFATTADPSIVTNSKQNLAILVLAFIACIAL